MAWVLCQDHEAYPMVPQQLGEGQTAGKFATRPSQGTAELWG